MDVYVFTAKQKGRRRREHFPASEGYIGKGLLFIKTTTTTKPVSTQLLKSCLKFQTRGMMLFVETESHHPYAHLPEPAASGAKRASSFTNEQRLPRMKFRQRNRY